MQFWSHTLVAGGAGLYLQLASVQARPLPMNNPPPSDPTPGWGQAAKGVITAGAALLGAPQTAITTGYAIADHIHAAKVKPYESAEDYEEQERKYNLLFSEHALQDRERHAKQNYKDHLRGQRGEKPTPEPKFLQGHPPSPPPLHDYRAAAKHGAMLQAERLRHHEIAKSARLAKEDVVSAAVKNPDPTKGDRSIASSVVKDGKQVTAKSQNIDPKDVQSHDMDRAQRKEDQSTHKSAGATLKGWIPSVVKTSDPNRPATPESQHSDPPHPCGVSYNCPYLTPEQNNMVNNGQDPFDTRAPTPNPAGRQPPPPNLQGSHPHLQGPPPGNAGSSQHDYEMQNVNPTGQGSHPKPGPKSKKPPKSNLPVSSGSSSRRERHNK